MCMFFCLFPLSGTILGAASGLLVDLFGEKEKTGEDSGKDENGVFMLIPWGKNGQIAIKEKTVNNCIIAGIVLWVLLSVLFSILFADLPKR